MTHQPQDVSQVALKALGLGWGALRSEWRQVWVPRRAWGGRCPGAT